MLTAPPAVTAVLEVVGSGCEGTVWAGILADGTPVAVKHYRRRAELERHLVGAALLDAALREQGRTRLVRLPEVVCADLDGLTVVSTPYVREPAGPPGPGWAQSRVRARTAVVCAAGVAAAYPADVVRVLTAARYGPRTAAHLRRHWFEGVALNDAGLRTDGESWFLVDF